MAIWFDDSRVRGAYTSQNAAVVTAALASIIAAVLYVAGPAVLQIALLALFICTAQLRPVATFVVVGIFFAIALSPLVIAVRDFTGSYASVITVFGIAWFVNVLIMGTALSTPSRWRPVCVVLGVVALSVSPLASVAVVSVLPFAGVLFPGSGTAGLLLLLGAIALLVSRVRMLPIASVLAGSLMAQAVYSAPMSIESVDTHSIVGLDTADGAPSVMERQAFRVVMLESKRDQVLTTLKGVTGTTGAITVVFPESAFGYWNLSVAQQLGEFADGTHRSVTVLGGARLTIATRDSDSRALFIHVLINAVTGKILYEQQNPIPGLHRLAIERHNETYTERHTQQKVAAAFPVAGQGTRRELGFGVLICGELINAWRSFRTFSEKTDTVIWIANLGWTDQSYFKKRLTLTAKRWGRLYNTRVITAVNSSPAASSPLSTLSDFSVPGELARNWGSSGA